MESCCCFISFHFISLVFLLLFFDAPLSHTRWAQATTVFNVFATIITYYTNSVVGVYTTTIYICMYILHGSIRSCVKYVCCVFMFFFIAFLVSVLIECSLFLFLFVVFSSSSISPIARFLALQKFKNAPLYARIDGNVK